MIKLDECNYRIFTNDGIKITMVIDFKNKSFTLQTNRGKCDFIFLDTKPEYALKVLKCMREGAEFAQALLKEHAEGRSGGIGG